MARATARLGIPTVVSGTFTYVPPQQPESGRFHEQAILSLTSDAVAEAVSVSILRLQCSWDTVALRHVATGRLTTSVLRRIYELHKSAGPLPNEEHLVSDSVGFAEAGALLLYGLLTDT
jgi:hypothetical protein